MPLIPPHNPADRFARIIDALCRAVAASAGGKPLTGPLVILIWCRLRRLAGRFDRLAARIRTGRRPARRLGPSAPRPRRPAPDPAERLPDGYGWLVRLVPQAAAAGSQLRHLLADPEMTALVAAAPKMGRILRPLCRMLGVDPPPGLRRPPTKAAPDPAAPARPACTVPGETVWIAERPRRRRNASRPPRGACDPPPVPA